MKLLIFVTVLFTYLNIFAAQRNLIAVGQGISSPAITSNLVFSNGFTTENPTGIAYQNGVRISGLFDTGSDSADDDSSGAEIGIGNGDMGIALGYAQTNCDGCEGDFLGGFGLLVSDLFGFGLSGMEDVYSAGLILNPKGSMRLGFAASLFDLGGSNNKVTSYGVGFSYYGSSWNFAVDASKRTFENSAVDDETVMITPGLAMNIDNIHFTVNMDIYTNEPEGTNTDEDLWFGVGYGHGDPFNITLYHDYRGEWSLVLALFF